MNTTLKRVISLMLCFVLMAGILPVGAMAAEGEETVATESTEATREATEPAASEEPSEPEGDTAPSEEVAESTEEVTEPAGEEIASYGLTRAADYLDAAIFCSDLHGETGNLVSILGQLKNTGVTYSSIGLVGDTCLTVSSVTSTISNALGYTPNVMFSYAASHDTEDGADISTNWDYSGEVKGVSSYYLVYTIRETDMQNDTTAEDDFTTWYNSLTDAQKKLPIFIMSHRPLHHRRKDNANATDWYNAISTAAKTSDIVFFWAHNHTSESDVDTAAYYVAKNGTESIQLGTTSSSGGDTVVPNFTYMNAGYIDANGQNPARKPVATTVQITSDSLIFQDYTTSGEYTDSSYSHNVTVAREFASTTDSGDSTDTTEPTEGEDEDTTVTYNYTATASTDGTGYILVSNGYALQNNDGSISSVAVTVSDDGSTITFADTVDVSTILWTIDSDGDVMNDGYYLLRASGADTKSMTISTTDSGDAYSNWTYSSDTLTTTGGSGGNTTFYAYCTDGTFYTQSSSSQELKFYVPSSTPGGSTEGGSGDSGDSGNTGSGDSGNTGDSTEIVVGDATVTTATDGSWQTVTFGTTTTEKKTVYVLTSNISSGTAYLIANSNSAGSAYVVANNSGSVAATGVTVKSDDVDGDGDTETYIELTDATDELWTASGSSSTTLKNGNYYLYGSGSDLSLSTSNSRTWSWSSSNSRLSYSSGSGNKEKTYYLVYGNSGWDTTSQSDNVYFYVPTEVEMTTDTSVTYSVTASDIEHFYTADETDTETATITKSVTDGAPDGTYTYEIVEGGDDIIASISDDGVITFNGAEGTAQVKVSYSWTEGEGDEAVTYTIWQVIDVTATSPYYTLDLHKANVTYVEATDLTAFEEGTTYFTKNDDGTYTKVASDAVFDSDVTYYTLSYSVGDDITAPIAIKGVKAGDKYGVWAVIKYFDGTNDEGEDIGAVGDAIEWSSSDPSVATVDPVTGIITFTGKQGTVNITATYKNGNQPFDTITISASPNQYSIPEDGTSDFPEYPNEGAIRFDKTATAVGNFSETGIAQVELSMTGVPYTKGSEIDVVIMLDITGSMHDVTTSSYTYSKYTRVEATIIATMEFVKSIVVNEDGTYNNNRVGVYSFNSGGTYTLWELGKVTNLDTINAAIQKFNDNYATGGTPYDDGLAKVQSVLSTAKTDGTGNNRQQFAVFMTDGVPTDYEYITGSTHANYSSASSIAGMLTSSDDYCTRDTDYYYEYYSTEMKGDGVTVYTVGIGLENTNSAWSGTAAQCLNLASRLLNDISGPAYETTQPDAVGTSTLSKQDSYFFSVDDANAASDMKNVFSNIAVKILQAATDVTVEDKITKEYTMIFDIPEGSKDITGVTNDFYIEFGKYALDENHERTTFTSLTKLYLKNTDGVYSAAKDSSGTAYDAPVFAQSTIGEKGTLYFWTTDASYADKAAVTYNDGTNTYYFIPYGMEANADGSAPTGWYNMTSGGYANGTVDTATNMSENLVIATPYFVYNAGTKMLYWTVDKLDTEEYVLRYFLYLDRSATEIGTDNEIPADAYPTNDHAYITYTNFNGNECQQEFPVPQLTWNGAQVSYVFYLVNAAGQPINKSGQVVDFANATFVTDVFTHTVVWNGDNAVEELNIDYLADELLPDDYKVYDENAKYTIHVYQTADGATVFDYFIIEGSAKDTVNAENGNIVVSVETTKVYNTKAGTKYDDYGVYSASEVGSTFTTTDADGNEVTIETTIQASLDYSDTTVAFAVLWEPNLVEDVVVVDFGLDVLIDVVANDNLQNTVSGIGLGNSAYGSIAMNTGVSTDAKFGTAALTIEGNTISIESENQIRFHQGDMLFAEPVTFYYESPVKFYENSNAKEGFMYSSVTVIPATTVYYEDSFVDLEVYTDADDTLVWTDTEGDDYNDTTRVWTVEGTTINATQAQDRPGQSQISATLDADNNYGYDGAYTNLSTYSMGSARMLTVDSTYFGKVKFDFCGTGFDVISMTSNDTGTIVVQVFDANGNSVRSIMVDTYYGYTLSGDEWVLSQNNPNALYQVPVVTVEGLDYGTYSVVITAAYNKYLDNVSDGSYDLYLDAIRIYNPTGNLNETANNAYKADGEGWPVYTELRDNVIAASNVKESTDANGDTVITGTDLSGAIFIDSNDGTKVIADYVSYGPNNELYLANGQSITFKVSTDANVADVQLGIKSATGAEVTYSINGDTYTVSTTSDMYYSILEYVDDASIVITNNTENSVLSLTTIKVTYKSAPAAVASDELLYNTEESATWSLRMLRSAGVTEEPEVTEPETEATVPETEATETEATVPETEATEPEVTEPETEATEPEVTEPETEATEPEVTEPETEATEPGVEEDDGAEDTIIETIGKIIKKLFGWLFG